MSHYKPVPSSPMVDTPVTFSFGKNWQDFVDHYFISERVTIAKEHLLELLQFADLAGLSFLDIGCGSGLSSLAALEAGAANIVSFDVDEHSVQATAVIRQRAGNPEHWQISQGSILDQKFLHTLTPADIVYSWGVLHHTGNMWQAIRNAAGLLKPSGSFYIALYTTTPKSDYWLRVKKRYNRCSSLGKRRMELWFVLRHSLLPLCLQKKNPIRHIREYQKKRGMAYLTNIRDWLGGYPYEHARIEEVLRFGRQRLNLDLINLKTGEANTEYVFRKALNLPHIA